MERRCGSYKVSLCRPEGERPLGRTRGRRTFFTEDITLCCGFKYNNKIYICKYLESDVYWTVHLCEN